MSIKNESSTRNDLKPEIDPNLLIRQGPDIIKEGKSEPEPTVFEGDVDLSGQGLTEIPKIYKDSIINGNFNISRNEIKDLRNSPKQINGDFIVHHNLLISLEHGPEKVTGQYLLYGNKIFLLYGIDKESRIYADFWSSPRSGFQGSLIAEEEQDRLVNFLGSSVYNEGNKLLSFKGLPNQYNVNEKGKLFNEAMIQFNKQSKEDKENILRLMKDWDPLVYDVMVRTETKNTSKPIFRDEEDRKYFEKSMQDLKDDVEANKERAKKIYDDIYLYFMNLPVSEFINILEMFTVLSIDKSGIHGIERIDIIGLEKIEKLTGMNIVDNLTFQWFGPGLYCSMLGPYKPCQDWITEEFKNELNKKQEQNK